MIFKSGGVASEGFMDIEDSSSGTGEAGLKLGRGGSIGDGGLLFAIEVSSVAEVSAKAGEGASSAEIEAPKSGSGVECGFCGLLVVSDKKISYRIN